MRTSEDLDKLSCAEFDLRFRNCGQPDLRRMVLGVYIDWIESQITYLVASCDAVFHSSDAMIVLRRSTPSAQALNLALR